MRVVARRSSIPLTLTIIFGASQCVGAEMQRIRPYRVITLNEPSQVAPAVVTGVALSAGGRFLAAAGDDHVVRLWDLGSDSPPRRMHGHTDWVRCVAFSPGGKTLVSAGDDRRVLFWDLETQATRRSPRTHKGAVTSVSFRPDGRFLAVTGREKALCIYDTNTLALAKEISCPCSDNRTVVFSPDGSRLTVAGRNGVIRIWDVSTGAKIVDIDGHRRRVRSLAFSPTGLRLASAGEGRFLRIWNSETGKLEVAIQHIPTKTLAIVFTAEDQLATGGSDNVVYHWDLQRRAARYQLVGHTGSVASLACDRGQGVLVSGSFDTTIRLWNLNAMARDATTRRSPDRQLR